MRIACVYHPRLNSGLGKFQFIAEAFESLGHDVVRLETMPDLIEADKTCDLIVFEQRGPGELCLPDLVGLGHNRRAIWAQWMFDLAMLEDGVPLLKQPGIEPFLDLMRVMDVVYVKERSLIDGYWVFGINAVYLDQGCPTVMRQADLKENPPFDVILWGSVGRFWQQRSRDVEALVAAGFVVGWASNEPGLPHGVARLQIKQPLDLPDLVEMGKVVLNVDARADVDGFWSDRTYLSAGAGACTLRRAGGGIQSHLCLEYDDHETLVSLAKDLCGNFEKREMLASLFRERVMKSHRYEHRCQEIVNYAQRLIDERHAGPSLSAMQGNESLEDQRQENAVSVLH